MSGEAPEVGWWSRTVTYTRADIAIIMFCIIVVQSLFDVAARLLRHFMP